MWRQEELSFCEIVRMRTPVETARQLRQKMTAHEKLLWRELRAHRFKGYKFRRQHPIVYETFERSSSFYVADFYCAARKLVIELDGKYHELPDQKEYDMARDKLMNEFGMMILRIKNEELRNMEVVLKKIEEFFLSTGPSPSR